ncbi:uncharacterized protein FOMMEDRAFT_20927 [Fomitiporia mediterranea MF3/22]|uniref:uncharacterized protein n=1 Tax=Fomitiporia mediterranea (strain MF3/22) TaxID=694068 RepID=UPI00044094F4|nr:uncharacterized protein FOMMEDRAFT_20927 [Fomitiporia mediterranea MF3/22]EJD02144.1 hypothetical protein FOMMEDRAFT_20927 [Fomitiporia mediterranea MF3/22]
MPAATLAASSSAPPVWKHFPFFDSNPVKDVHDLASPPEIFKNTPEISVITASTAGVLLADIYGSIHILNKEFESVRSWVAHVGGRVTQMVDRKGTLVTIGEEENVPSPLLKIWDLGKIDKKTGMPTLLRSVKIQHGTRPHPVSTVALSASLSHLAIGLADGTVLLYRHLDQSLSSSTALSALPKSRTLLEAPTEPITGLGFREPSAAHAEEAPHLHLFVTTTSRVLCFQVSGKGSGGSPRVVDEVGGNLGCAVMDWRARDIVVARDEAIYMYGTEGRGASVAYEGYKSSIHTHLNYLVIVSPPFTASAATNSATVRNFVSKNSLPDRTDVSKVTVFDLENKFVAYSDTFVGGARAVVSEWGHIYVLTNDGKLFCLEEKSTPEKLDMLYRKNLYLLALNLAKTQGLDESSVADIHRQYGDHLYSKGDYDGSMHQFIKTIGFLQPSYVIRKFLDAQRIHNLVTYLQDLHSLGLANSEHTTLLLNTYTKLKDVSRLDSFIKTEARPSSDSDSKSDEPPFDLETAIRVCRQAGYFEHASYLAKKYKRHEDYLRIQVEDAANYKDALAYVRRLEPETTESNLARYGRVLLANLPDETTQLLIDICTGSGPSEPDDLASAKKSPPPATSSYLSYLALGRVAPAAPESTPPSPSTATVKQADESKQPRRANSVHDTPRTGSPAPPTINVKPKPERRPSPRQYFSHFVDNSEKFVVFLEAVALRRWGQSTEEVSVSDSDALPAPLDEDADKRDQTAVWNTLLELYLTLAENEGEDSLLRAKALALLKSSTLPYDPTHTLMLCATRDFTPGLVLLWEKLGMYEDILRFWMAQETEAHVPEASTEVLRALERYGPENYHLYTLALRFLTSSAELLSRHAQELEGVLETIEREKIMPPLSVIQVLSRNNVTSVGLVKQWMLIRIKESRDEIQADQQLINSYRDETRTKLKQVEELSDPEHPRVFHVTRCSQCGGQLDLPTVHFMCNHSYHQRCLAENETECPNCARSHGMVREIRRNNERLAGQHDVFASEVKEGGFSAVAAGFSRGLMKMTRVDEVSAS